MLSVREALERILAPIEALGASPFSLSESVGLTLAEDVTSGEDQPPFDNSAMDGYALRSEDTPGTLEVVEAITAGRVPQKALGPGQASRINTGAMLPEGADAVVMVEHVSVAGQSVTVPDNIPPGENLRRAGEHLKQGETILERGRLVTPAALSMAAYLGYPQLRCHNRPRVAILSTGDELVEPGQPLNPGQIRNSNSYALEAQVRTAGGVPLRLPIAPDNPAIIERTLREALPQVDAVVTSAGVSMGEHDFVLEVLEKLGGRLDFWKIRMRPGKPLGFGSLEGKPFFGLPGNPVSSMVGFEIFVRPALLKMQGRRNLEPHRIQATLGEKVEKRKDFTFFYRCRLDGTTAYLTGPQGSHMLRSLVLADGLMELPEPVEHLAAGQPVAVRLLTG